MWVIGNAEESTSDTRRKEIRGLYIAVVDDHHNDPRKGTTYRVFLPVEISGIESKTKFKITGA